MTSNQLAPARRQREPPPLRSPTGTSLRWLRLACALVCLQAGGLSAQDVDVPARAKRDADNPFRMIIEASKLKPRQKAADAEPAAKPMAHAVPARAPTGKPTASIDAPQLAAAGVPERTASVALAAEVERPGPADTPRIEPIPSSARTDAVPMQAAAPVRTEILPMPPPTQMQEAAPSSSPSAPGPKAKPGAEAEPAPASELASNALQTSVLVAMPTPSAALQLADYVEPTLPDRLRGRLQGDGLVVVHFTVNPDGSVADASVLSSSDGVLDPIALDAVRKWRYRPISAAQAHAVQLVFRTRE
jgi:protein TonB